MKILLKYFNYKELAVLIAGLCLPFAFAPYTIYSIAILAPAVLLWTWLDASPARAFWRGWLFGAGFFGAGIYWVYISLHVYGYASPLFAAFATALLLGGYAFIPALQGYLLNRFFPKNNYAKLLAAFPASWIVFEWVRAWLFTGFPWLLLGYSQIDSPLRGLAPLFGVTGVSFAVIFSSALVVILLYYRKYWPVLVLAVLWISAFAFTHIQWTHPQGKPQSVSLIQGNIPQQQKWQISAIENILQTYVELTAQSWNSDLIVWPECAVVIDNIHAKEFIQNLTQAVQQHHTTLITGIPIIKDKNYYNGLIVLGNGSGEYLKHHLVPFGEYIPLRKFLELFKNHVQIPMSDFSFGGKKQQPLIANGLVIAPSICYEIIFSNELLHFLPQANLLLLVTDDSWFGESIALNQHLQMGQMRALETGRYLLFVANSGITAIINAQGQVQQTIPAFQTAILHGTVQPMQGRTPYVLWHNTPIYILCVLLLLLAIRRRKK